jgi:hypothetical protein
VSTVLLDFDGHWTYGDSFGPDLPGVNYPVDVDRITGQLSRLWWPFQLTFTTDQQAQHDHRVVFAGADLVVNNSYVTGYSLPNIWGKSPADDGGSRTEPYASYVGSFSNWPDPNQRMAEVAAHEMGHAAGLPHGPADQWAPLKAGSTSWRFSDVEAIATRHPELQPTAEVTAVVTEVQSRPWYGGQEIVLTNIT